MENVHTPPLLRLATPADLPALLPLFRAYQEHYGQLTSAGEEQTRAFLAEFLADAKTGFIVLACTEDRLVGFAAVYLTVSCLIARRIAHLGDLYVVPASRGAGVGTALLDAVSAEAGRRGIGLVRWLSLSSNTELNAWYRRLVEPLGTFDLYLLPTACGPSAPAAPSPSR
ncbi:MAG TPA: GNAT family N-acetyltransferase [Opitutaceae bacterium]|nr:GNAT family N-acetyltransferase [Opitutaceae bacterium]